MLRHLELVVDKWPIGPQNAVHSQGDRFFIDENAAFILVGMGKARYIDEEAMVGIEQPRTKRKYNRRDLKAR